MRPLPGGMRPSDLTGCRGREPQTRTLTVLRVEGVRSEVVAMHITLTWRDYCEAERMRNTFALGGILDDLQNLEQQYALLNDGRELPLRPCP